MTLEWSTVHDLDLSVEDPTGAVIYYGALTSPSGGVLDIDSHPDCVNADGPGVENIFWPEDGAPSGTYTVKVTNYSSCDFQVVNKICNDQFMCVPQ